MKPLNLKHPPFQTLCAALAAWLCLAAIPATAQLSYITNSDNTTVTITGYNTAAGLNVVIPSSTNGYLVTAIGSQAFYNDGRPLTTITNVTIPNSVTSIGYGAFIGCSGLTSVTIPNSVTTIGDTAFYGCSGLTSIAVDAANPSYASTGGVLFNKSLTLLIQCPGGLTGSYAIPNSVTTIGDEAFGACSGLTSMTIGDSVTTIYNYAFAYCSGLTNVVIGNNVTNLGQYAFYWCSSLTSVTIGNSVTSIGQYAFDVCSSLTSVTIGNGVTTIGQYAFTSCSGLTSVTIPSSVTSIGQAAFSGCSGLTSVVIPNSVTSLGQYAFGSCFGLTNAYFQGNAPTVVDRSGNIIGAGSADTTIFSSDPSGTVYYLPGATGWGSTFGGWPTAVGCAPVTGFTYTTNNGAITITGYTGSSGSVTIPASTNGYPVTAIGANAFYGLTTLTNVTIPNSVTSLGQYAFYGCPGLTSVTVPGSVTNLGSYAFYCCYGLTNVSFQGNAPTVNSAAGSADTTVFANDQSGTVYYLSGTTGWGSTFGGWPTASSGSTATPPAVAISTYGNQPAIFFPTATGTNFALQMTTNLASGNWVTVTNGFAITGMVVTNAPGAAFFRLH